MKLGITVMNFSWPQPPSNMGPTVAHIASLADDAGVDSIWTMDHFFQIGLTGLPPEAPMLEAYAALAFIAGQTRRIRLGTLVTSVAYRHPGVLIKMVTSLDVLSAGRMALGIGVGYAGSPSSAAALTGESRGLGIPFASLAERYEQLEEVLRIAHQMWRGDAQPFDGRYYHLARPLNSPNSLQRPRPPILIGGGGERKTLRLVAQYGDACNLFDIPNGEADIARKLRVLRAYCAESGRDYTAIEKTAAGRFDLGPDTAAGAQQVLNHLRDLAGVGIEHVILAPSTHPWDDASLQALVSILPEVHAIPTASAPE
jgi:F420-dependent oxidoreductase-like protein